MTTKTAVEWFADGLRARGVEWIAALCGHGLDPLFHACRRAGIRIVDTRNEQTAAYMADGYGRLTKKPGVCAVSAGVAVANALTGVMNAWFDHAPMLLISGSANHSTLGMGCFQDSDHTALAAPVTVFSRTIDSPTRVMQILDEAWCAAHGGPVHLMFPMDVQRTEVSENVLVVPDCTSDAKGTSTQQIEVVARAILEAKQPLIVAGSKLYYNGEGEDLAELAEQFQIPVQTPIWDRGIFDEPSEAFVGVVGSATGGPALIEQTDCLILAGAESDYRLGYLQRKSPHLRLDRGWRQLHEKLVDFGAKPFEEWLANARYQRDDYKAKIEGLRHGPIHAVDVVKAIEAVLPEDGSLVIDGGSIGQWAHQLLTDHRYPHQWLTCGRSGVVGYGLGGAMAARLAFPGRPVVLLSGDGAFTFTVAEIECAVRQKLPFVAIVADDQCWGITHSGHVKQFGHGIGTVLGPIDFAKLAEALGARGVKVESAEAIAPALREAIASETVTVLHVPIVGGNPV